MKEKEKEKEKETEKEKERRERARVMWTDLHWQMLPFAINSISNKQLCP